MRDEARQADGVDRHVAVHQRRGPRGGAARLVELAVVVELDDLGRRHVLGRLGGEAHHEHRADREVRAEQHLAGTALALERLHVPPRGPDDAVHARPHAGARVGQGGVRAGEVDHDVQLAEDVLERRSQRRVHPGGEDEVVGGLDRLAGRRAHPAGGPGHSHADHAADRSRPRPQDPGGQSFSSFFSSLETSRGSRNGWSIGASCPATRCCARCSSELNSAPKRIAMFVIHSQTRKAMTPPSEP